MLRMRDVDDVQARHGQMFSGVLLRGHKPWRGKKGQERNGRNRDLR
jgi:hypothetical protein